jgi:hypothetical protein
VTFIDDDEGRVERSFAALHDPRDGGIDGGDGAGGEVRLRVVFPGHVSADEQPQGVQRRAGLMYQFPPGCQEEARPAGGRFLPDALGGDHRLSRACGET